VCLQPCLPPVLNAARVGWVRVGLEASKLFITATTIAEWSVVDTKTVAGRLAESPQGAAVEAGPELLKVNYDADLPGLRSKTTLWMDPVSGNSLQYEVRDSGKRYRERIVRFTEEGAYHRTRRPRPAESVTDPATWTDASEGFWPYGQRLVGTLACCISLRDQASTGQATRWRSWFFRSGSWCACASPSMI
jgi:hypothetical protein